MAPALAISIKATLHPHIRLPGVVIDQEIKRLVEKPFGASQKEETQKRFSTGGGLAHHFNSHPMKLGKLAPTLATPPHDADGDH